MPSSSSNKMQTEKKALHDADVSHGVVTAVPVAAAPEPVVAIVEEDPFSSEIADACLDWVIFPSLLFIQFGATMYCQMKNPSSIDASREFIVEEQAIEAEEKEEDAIQYHIIDWKTVNMTVFAFCLVAGIYRQIMRRHNATSNTCSRHWFCCLTNNMVGRLFLLLLPEIFTNILLAVVMVSTIENAYTALVLLTLMLSFIGIMAGIDLLWNMDDDDEEDTDDDVYQLLLDEDSTEEEGTFVC